MSSCVYIPTIKVGKEEKESRLFKDLLSFTNDRNTTKYIWGMTKLKEFNSKFTELQFDENGEPTLDSLNKAIKITSLLKDSNLTSEKRDLGSINDKGDQIEYKNVEEPLNKVNQFNKENSELVASVGRLNGSYIINLEKKNNLNTNVPNELLFKTDLNNKLRGLMRGLGFDVSVTNTDGYYGVFNPLNAETNAEGLRTVIQVAKGEKGEEAFPEEFSHFIIEGLINEPLINRLVDSLKGEEILKTILGEDYDKYNSLYEGNTTLLQKEAAGKLLYNHIIGKTFEPRRPLLTRIWNWLKIKLSRLDSSNVDDIIREANIGFSKVAQGIKDESILGLIDKSSIRRGPKLYQIAKEVTKLQKIADDALELASRRLKILQTKSKDNKYPETDMASIKNLQNLIEQKKYASSILAFQLDSLDQLSSLNDQLNSVYERNSGREIPFNKLNIVSSIVRRIDEFSTGYKPIMEELQVVEAAYKRGEIDIKPEDATAISSKATEILRIINEINQNKKELNYKIALNFLKPFWGEDKIVDVGKDKGKKVTLEMILEMAQKDINGLDRWISSLSDASDPLLSLIDKSVKMKQAQRDEKLINILRGVREEHSKLEKAGYNPEFMYEKDSNGKLTGRLLSDINFIKFDQERQAYIDKLKTEDTPYYKTKELVEKWEAKRMEYVLVDADSERYELMPIKLIYGKDVISKLVPAQLKYYNTMIKAKALMDSMLPDRYTKLYNAVQIRNDITEAISNNITDPKQAAKFILDNIKDRFIKREDDTEFGEEILDGVKTKLLDFNKKEVQKLPIYYIHKLEDTERLSTDFTSSIMAYAAMSINYNEMSEVVDTLEIIRSVVKERDVQQLSGDQKLLETFKVLNKAYTKSYTKPGELSNIGARLDDYYETVLYGKSKTESLGTTKIADQEISNDKVIDSLKDLTGAIGLGVNVFSGINNTLMGKMQLFIESLGGEYFNLKNSAIGKKNYYFLLKDYIGEINSITKTNKLNLLIDRFDALESFYENLQNQGYYKGAIARIVGSTSIFFMQNMGEHYLHSRTMLAMLDAFKVKDSNGNKISLYEALEVKDSELVIKEGITKLDGTQITEEDLNKLKLKIKKVNQSLNGAFSIEDKGAIHKNALGRLAMQFRQWMPSHYGRRFANTYYDASLDQYREGYYRTLGRFAWDTIKDLKRANFELVTRWEQLNSHERANMKRSFTEIGIFATLAIVIAMLGSAKDKKGLWGERMLLYQLKRLKLETGASMPFLPDFLKNATTLLQSPAASIKTFNNIASLFEVWNMFNEIESGRYKGWSEYERDLVNNIPIYGQVKKTIDLGNEDYMFTIFNK